MSNQEPWYVYVVECSDNTLYTGISNNVSKRVLKHNTGKGAKYTRSRLPVALKWFKLCENKSEAAKEEYKIKKLNKKQKLKLINMTGDTEITLTGDREITLTANNEIDNPYLFKRYKVNVDNIETIEDIKLILKHMDLHFHPKNDDVYEEIKHLLDIKV